MTRLQFWILTSTSLVVSLLFVLQIFLGWQVKTDSHQLVALEQIIERGQQSYGSWKQVATRTAQLSQQDPALKNVLSRQQINITYKSPETPVGARPTAAPSQGPIQN